METDLQRIRNKGKRKSTEMAAVLSDPPVLSFEMTCICFCTPQPLPLPALCVISFSVHHPYRNPVFCMYAKRQCSHYYSYCFHIVSFLFNIVLLK